MSMDKGLSVLLLDAEFVQSYSIARSLKDKGYRVVAAMPTKLSYGYFSKYPDKKIISPDSEDEINYLHFLKNVIKKEDINIIIPITNNTAELLSKYYSELSSLGVKLSVMPYDIFKIAHSKEMLMKLCEENNLPHPRTSPVNLNNYKSVVEYVKFPALIKPNISVGARGIVRVNSIDEVREKLPEIINEFGECTLQEFIDNSDYYYNVMMYRSETGEILSCVIIKIQRFFPIKGGSSSFCVTVSNPALEKICKNVLDILDWHGFADFDVLYDKIDGFKIIEINPRLPASVHAAYCAGVNFPAIIAEDLMGEKNKKIYPMENISLRFLLMDIMWFLASPKRFSLGNNWMRFFSKNLFYQDISKEDPLIFLAGLLNGFSKLCSPKYWKNKLLN